MEESMAKVKITETILEWPSIDDRDQDDNWKWFLYWNHGWYWLPRNGSMGRSNLWLLLKVLNETHGIVFEPSEK